MDGLITQVKKNYEVKLTIYYLLTSFDPNTHYLMRQDVRLLYEVLYIYAHVIHLTSHLIFIRDTQNKYARYYLSTYLTNNISIYTMIFQISTCEIHSQKYLSKFRLSNCAIMCSKF